MNLRQLTIGLTAFSLLQLAVPSISSNGKISIDLPTATASQQTDRLWRKYLGGRKIVEFSSYSSGYGGGGMSSKKELHFCSNGQFAYAAQSSVSVDVSGASAGGSGGDRRMGTWKILESNKSLVAIEFMSSAGEKQQSILGLGQDGRLYNNAGKKLLTTSSDACR